MRGLKKARVGHKGCWRLRGSSEDCEGPRGCRGPSEITGHYLLALGAQFFTIELFYIVFANSFVFALGLVTGVTRGPCPLGWLHGFMRVWCTSHRIVEKSMFTQEKIFNS
jgi:hypothetical protein